MTDVELLERHRSGSDQAFADLVRRHLGWVYAMARRRLKDSHLAEDVAQAVFVLLHRKVPHFPADGAMIRWLHKTTWYATESVAKSERRRRKRETEAAIMQPTTTDSPSDEWEELAPVLDQLIERLSPTDREAVLLRYFRDLSFAEVARQIGTTEDTARKRVERAIEKLRHLASSKGVEVSASVLALNLTNHLITSPPAGLIAATTGSALAPAGSALLSGVSPITKGAIVMMGSTKLTIVGFAAATALIVGGGACISVALNDKYNPPPVAVRTTAPSVSEALATPNAMNPLSARQTWAANNSYPKLAPFSGIRWRDTTPEVLVNGTWYEWLALNDQTSIQIVDAARRLDPQSWQKRVNEDLVELMAYMGHEPGKTVTLQLGNLQTNEVTTLQNVPMTEANRQAIWAQTNGVTVPGQADRTWSVGNSYPKLAPFSGIRWHDTTPEVLVNGTWYEWLALDDQTTAQIVKAAQQLDARSWQKRVNEDLVELMAHMGHQPGATVSLQLRNLQTNETTVLKDVPMTEANRQAIWAQTNQR